MYIMENAVRIAKWGNSLAVRLPSGLVQKLELKEGDEIEIGPASDSGKLEVTKRPSRQQVIESLREFRGTLPHDFKFDREEANER